MLSPENLRQDALFAAEVALPLVGAVALYASRTVRGFAMKGVESIIRAGKIEDEMSTYPELTLGEARGFVTAEEQIQKEDERRMAV
ncbi:MAG: hypothetical protein WC880_01215 [Candidatus Paceibacterota bacterium]